MSLSIGVIAAKPAVAEQLATLLETTGHRVGGRAIVPVRKPELTAQLKAWIADPEIQLVIGIDSATMRAALLPLITKRLVGFTDVRGVDGGQCESTIVILLPKSFSLETVEPILPRVERELAPRGRRQPTQPPPPPRGRSVTEPPPVSARSKPKTNPPPMPAPEPDFVHTHVRPPEREFAEQVVSAISPIRLEQLPVVVRPIVQPPPAQTYRKWIAIGAAVVAGALVGGVMRAVSSSSSSSLEGTEVAQTEPHDVSHIELGVAAVDISDEGPRPFDIYDRDPIEMPALRLRRPEPKIPLWKIFTPEKYPPAQLRRVAQQSFVQQAKAPAPAPPAARAPTAAELWSTMGTDPQCDPISCAMADFAPQCCDRYRMNDCADALDFAQAASCHLSPRR